MRRGRGRARVGRTPSSRTSILTDVALGDVNGDERTDILVAGATGARVLLQGVAGTFPSAALAGTQIATGALASIAAGRFDGNATLDVAVSHPSGDEVLVRLGSGGPAGTFTERPGVAASDNPGALAVGDLDLDGATDLVVAAAIRRSRTPRTSATGRRSTEASGTARSPRRDHPGPHRRAGGGRERPAVDRGGGPRRRRPAGPLVRRQRALVGDRGPEYVGDSDTRRWWRGRQRGRGGGTGPGLSIGSARRQVLSLVRGVTLSVSCAAACTVTAAGKLSLKRRARKRITLGKATRRCSGGDRASCPQGAAPPLGGGPDGPGAPAADVRGDHGRRPGRPAATGRSEGHAAPGVPKARRG